MKHPNDNKFVEIVNVLRPYISDNFTNEGIVEVLTEAFENELWIVWDTEILV